VIPYHTKKLILHELVGVDESGNITSRSKDIKNIFQPFNSSNGFSIQLSQIVTVNIHDNHVYNKFLNEINNILDAYSLFEESSINDFLHIAIQKYILNQADKFSYNIPTEILIEIVNRMCNSKPINVNSVISLITNKSNIPNSDKFLNWITTFEYQDQHQEFNKLLSPIKILFSQLGTVVLEHTSNLLLNNDTDALTFIKDKVHSVLSTRDHNNTALKNNVEVLNNSGGLHSLTVPSEGIIFTYKGTQYKLTGLFGPINQILGYEKYK
jgi:hypothetical protein